MFAIDSQHLGARLCTVSLVTAISLAVKSGGIIGVSGGGGLPTSSYLIVRNTFGELVTMYPVR